MSGTRVSRRDFLRIASSAAAAAALVSCAPATQAPGTQPTPATGSTSAATKTPVKLRWWGGVPEASGPKQTLEIWNKEHPEIQVEYVQYPNNDEGNVKLDIALQAPGEVDVCVSYGLNRLKQRADGGALEPLDAYLNGFDPVKEYGKLDNQWNGKFWALILNSQPFFVFLNKKALDEAGLKVPTDWTWEEYMDYAKKLTKGSGATKQWGAFYGDEQIGAPVINSKGGDYIYKDDCHTNYDDPMFLQALNWRLRMQNEDKSIIPLGEVQAGKLQPYSEFLQGHTAMLLQGSWILRYVKDVANNPRDFKVAFAPSPHLKEGADPFRPGTADDRCSIAAKSRNKEAAWQFMKWWGTEGYISMTPFGRMTLWRGRKAEDSIKAFTADFADYEKHMDLEQYKLVMFGNAAKDYPLQFKATAAAEISQITKEEYTKALLGEQKPDVTMTNIKKRSDEALGKVCKS